MGIILKNLMETVVLDKLDEIFDSLDCCKCELCKKDIASLALNNLPPKYVVTHEGELLSKLNIHEKQYKTDIIKAIIDAAEIIKDNPRHQQFK